MRGCLRYGPGSERKTFDWRDKEFVRIADQWMQNGAHPPRLVQARQKLVPIGPPVQADAKALIDASKAGLEVTSAGPGLVQLNKKVTGSTICFYDATGYVPIAIEENSITKPPLGEANPDSDNLQNKQESPKECSRPLSPNNINYTLLLRSVEQIFYYLGEILGNDYTRDDSQVDPGCPRISFRISGTPLDKTRFPISYRGTTYFVAGADSKIPNTRNPNSDCGYDNTLIILALLNDLLNLNRSASEVPTTKAVQAVGGSP